MLGLLDYLKLGAGAAAGALLTVMPAYYYGKHEGRQQAAAAALTASVKATKDRANENNSVNSLDAYGLCIELGGLPDDCNAELRRMGEDHDKAGDGGVSGGQRPDSGTGNRVP